MKFAHPELIPYSVGLVIALAGFHLWAFARRKKLQARFAQEVVLKELLGAVDVRRQRIKAVMLVLGVVCGLIAWWRPQWGFHWQEAKRKGRDIIIALDTSKSMRAQDIKPDRLQRAKLAIRDSLRYLQGDRVALIAFAGTAFLQCPLTIDYNGFLLSLEGLDTDTIPRGGTSLSSAIREALRSAQGTDNQYKALVIITDGEDHEGNPLEAAEEAKKQGLLIYCIGVGTTEGELVMTKDDSGGRQYLKDREGNVVKSHLEESLLQRIALTTGGSYVHATPTEFGLDFLYREKIAKIAAQEFEGKMMKRYEERFVIPLALAFLLFVLEPFIHDRKM